MIYLFTLGLLFILLYETCWFLISLILKRNDIADIAWGLGFALIALSFPFFFSPPPLISMIGLSFPILWGLRLSIYLAMRNLKKKEDFRYQEFRKKWGSHPYLRSFLQVYLLQGFLMWLIAFPIFIPIVSHVQSPLTLFHVLGGVVFFTGFLIESIADWQLSQFKKNSANKGKIMTQGLWSRSRHPNYFGEILVWWGIFIYTLPLSHGWIGVVSPITLTFLLVKVSGVPMLERKYEGNIQYEKYKQTTPRLWLF